MQVMPTSPFSRLRAYGDGADDESALKYIAHALDIHDHVAAAAAGRHGLLLLEDDLLPGSADVGALRRRLQETLRLLPPSADMLYLEYCFETCSRLQYPPPQADAGGYERQYADGYERDYASGGAGIARAYAPSCCAAVYLTARGARRLAALILPVFDVIDRMYQYLVQAGLLEAYVAVPPLFYQVRCCHTRTHSRIHTCIHTYTRTHAYMCVRAHTHV